MGTINHILDLVESGQTYTKREQPTKQTIGKRKRGTSEQDDELEERVRRDRHLYASDNREQPRLSRRDPPLLKHMISGDFPFVPIRTVQSFLSMHNYLLFPAYLALNEAIQQTDKTLSWKYKKTATLQLPRYREENINESIRSADTSLEEQQQEVELMEELKAARLARRHANLMRQKELEALETEKRNFDEAQSKGELKECECCFVDTPYNRLVHCNNENAHVSTQHASTIIGRISHLIPHESSFCIQCARRNAETQVGLSKYELECLSTEGCKAGFSYQERRKFLTESLASALDRIEQDENLRLAGLSDLAKCPFCSYAEEYPPVAINKEFRCRKLDCMITSCRLCDLETHIPKTCKEASLEKKRDIRREVEEAMSKALIRNCNKCNTPFVKESGCNKMTCSKPGCRNVQCYVCHKSCDYNHFDRPERGGKAGNCPLFEDSEKRHYEEVEEAEKNAKRKLLQDNPDLEPDVLDFNVSSKVKKDDARRLTNSAAATYPARRLQHRRYNNDHRQDNARQDRELPRAANEPIQHNPPRQQNEPVRQPQAPDNRQQIQPGQGQAYQDAKQERAMFYGDKVHQARAQALRAPQQAEPQALHEALQQTLQLQARQQARQQAKFRERQQKEQKMLQQEAQLKQMQQQAKQQERQQKEQQVLQQEGQLQQMRQQAVGNVRNLHHLPFRDVWQNFVKNPRPLPIPFQGAPAQQVQVSAPQQVPAGSPSQQGFFPQIPNFNLMPPMMNLGQLYQFAFPPPDGNNDFQGW
ncbi:unnamed protein product [Fusarium langsethiae]|nr:unnamed protein product [Fusarium langsethiae]